MLGTGELRYNSYIYRPGKRNVFSPEELADMRAFDKEVDKIKFWPKYDEDHPKPPKPSPEEARLIRREKRKIYNEKNKDWINERDKKRRKARKEELRNEKAAAKVHDEHNG